MISPWPVCKPILFRTNEFSIICNIIYLNYSFHIILLTEMTIRYYCLVQIAYTEKAHKLVIMTDDLLAFNKQIQNLSQIILHAFIRLQHLLTILNKQRNHHLDAELALNNKYP